MVWFFRDNLDQRMLTAPESPSLAGAWRGVWPILSLALVLDPADEYSFIFRDSLVLAAAYRIVCFASF
jgi:hypothetical protein